MAEDAGDVGGKVFFLITQGLAIAPLGSCVNRQEILVIPQNKLRDMFLYVFIVFYTYIISHKNRSNVDIIGSMEPY